MVVQVLVEGVLHDHNRAQVHDAVRLLVAVILQNAQLQVGHLALLIQSVVLIAMIVAVVVVLVVHVR